MRTFNTILINTFILALLGLTSCSSEEQQEEVTKKFTTEEQSQLGDIIVSQIVNDPIYKIVPENQSPEIYEYLNSALNSISSSFILEDGQFYNWEIFLVDSDEANAYTLPGGKIFLTKGMLAFLGAENQLMSVIAHEMAYAEKGFAQDYINDMFGQNASTRILSGFYNQATDFYTALIYPNYTAAQIKTADEFSAMVLCPFTYTNGLVDVITLNTGATGDNMSIDMTWIDYKFNYSGRVELIESFAPRFCCHGEETYEVRYEQLMEQYLDGVTAVSNS